jgi:hypothetical protein
MTRFMIVVIASAMLASAGCGGDDGSKDASGTTGAKTTSTADTTGSKHAESKPKAAPKPDESSASRRRSEAFRRGRDTCRAHGVAELARKYDVPSSNPYRVAQAYATKTYRPSVRPDGYEGCLLGLKASTGSTSAPSPSP